MLFIHVFAEVQFSCVGHSAMKQTRRAKEIGKAKVLF